MEKKVDKGDYLITHFRNAVPRQFFMRCGSSKIIQLSNQGGKQARNTGGKRIYHSYLVLFCGKFRAHVYGCETTYKDGFEEDQLSLLAFGVYAKLERHTVSVGASIGNCKWIKSLIRIN